MKSILVIALLPSLLSGCAPSRRDDRSTAESPAAGSAVTAAGPRHDACPPGAFQHEGQPEICVPLPRGLTVGAARTLDGETSVEIRGDHGALSVAWSPAGTYAAHQASMADDWALSGQARGVDAARRLRWQTSLDMNGRVATLEALVVTPDHVVRCLTSFTIFEPPIGLLDACKQMTVGDALPLASADLATERDDLVSRAGALGRALTGDQKALDSVFGAERTVTLVEACGRCESDKPRTTRLAGAKEAARRVVQIGPTAVRKASCNDKLCCTYDVSELEDEPDRYFGDGSPPILREACFEREPAGELVVASMRLEAP